jgi:hypothetical protein
MRREFSKESVVWGRPGSQASALNFKKALPSGPYIG